MKITIDHITIDAIAACTDENDHNESVAILARMLADDEAVATISTIQSVHGKLGYMPSDLIELRSIVRRRLVSETANPAEVNAAF
jgi:hypothetical protein